MPKLPESCFESISSLCLTQCLFMPPFHSISVIVTPYSYYSLESSFGCKVAAWLLAGTMRKKHITTILPVIYWLPIASRTKSSCTTVLELTWIVFKPSIFSFSYHSTSSNWVILSLVSVVESFCNWTTECLEKFHCVWSWSSFYSVIKRCKSRKVIAWRKVC